MAKELSSHRVHVTLSNGLLRLVDRLYPFGVVHLLVFLLPSLVNGVHSSKVRWTPHFISVELIRAPHLVAIRLSVNAIIKRVSCFEAKFLIPGHLLGVPLQE